MGSQVSAANHGRLLVALLVVVANGTGCDRWKSEQSTDTAETKIAPASAPVVHALGRIEPESRIVNVAAPMGSIVSKLNVQAGHRVSAGKVIAILDTHEEMSAALELARIRLRDAGQRLAVESRISQAAIDNAQVQQQRVEEVLQLEIRAQETLVRLGEAKAEEASRDIQRAKLLQAGDVISSSELDDLNLARRSADEALQHSKQVLEQLRRDRELKMELASLRLKEAMAQKERQEIVAEVDALAKSLSLAETRLERTLVRAPIDGDVIKVDTRPGERIVNGPILRLGDTRVMFVVAEVYETDVKRVATGQRATVISRAFPDELSGTVVQIGSLVERNDVLSADPTADVDARIVEVRIKLDDGQVAANYNQHQVDVRIQVEGPPRVPSSDGEQQQETR